MRIRCLGTGTSFGVPMIGCDCPVCRSSDLHNHRYRCSVLLELPGGNLLIDTPPELRLACLNNDISKVDAVALTHTHADHVMGMDDLRAFTMKSDQPMPIYAEPQFLDDVRRIFRYVFVKTQEGGGKPRLNLCPLESGRPVEILGAPVLPLRVMHGDLPVTAFRIGRFAYVTDVRVIPGETMDALRNLDVLILGAIRMKPHSTHLSIPEAMEVARELAPAQTFFTHMTHNVDHEELSRLLPPGMAPAHDGMAIEVSL